MNTPDEQREPQKMADFLTPQTAADRAKTSRATIVRALQNKEISADRDNSGRWKITPEAVDAWTASRGEVFATVRVISDHAHKLEQLENTVSLLRDELAASREQVAKLTGEATARTEHLADARAERDRLRDALEVRSRRGIFDWFRR